MDFIANLDFGYIITVAMAILSSATFITALTPTKTDDKIVSFLLKILNFLAGNIGKNKNADAE